MFLINYTKSKAIVRNFQTVLLLLCIAFVGAACVDNPSVIKSSSAQMAGAATGDPNSFMVVDCLLPGQLRKLGATKTYLTARRAVRTSALDCEIRGGEYVAYDRANYATSLKVWLPLAEKGDTLAQVYVGEIFEKGMGLPPDYATAAHWYRKAADQGSNRAQISLGFLYERGLGVNHDPVSALNWYRKAAGMPEVITLESQPPTSPVQVQSLQATDRGTIPQIELIEPPLKATRSIEAPIIKTRSNQSRTIVGRVIASTAITRLSLNNQPLTVDAQGLFRGEIQIADSSQPVEIIAVDKKARTGSLRIIFVPESVEANVAVESAETASLAITASAIHQIDFGNYHALIIGNEDYLHLQKLDTPVNDANAIAKVLHDHYGFRNTLLLNANRYQILSAINKLREDMTDKDNLLIYYAGHGTLDRVNMRGYWQPVDAEESNTANWISTFDITDLLNVMSAKGVLVIADSCYSGAMTLSSVPNLAAGLSEEKRLQAFKQISSKRSRTVLTSGGLAPVLDGGGDGHSLFSKALLDMLENNHDIVEGLKLYQNTGKKVSFEASKIRFSQVPQYAAIRNAGHEAGDFFFVPR
ncbi:MAG: caspase family protein [Candidatus Competibacteraceae bacterium]|uniref:TPR repeat, SEL1 subfamily protein n=1 Tax=Candidatus Contendobacter odensis Run_B_J11 TaxID=1400861 RepID=A0A7U7GB60_9GAMM|nr:caspase family protein [Candidatus Contendobacter odensis]MBK8533754.1 caspase family protein [Candidatus Competibacteraceae bacterium]CDH45111.1 putative TPR repeat, SEL1 subfamily protein [Candidatus Contendobacter odensis Run_B_J11]